MRGSRAGWQAWALTLTSVLSPAGPVASCPRMTMWWLTLSRRRTLASASEMPWPALGNEGCWRWEAVFPCFSPPSRSFPTVHCLHHLLPLRAMRFMWPLESSLLQLRWQRSSTPVEALSYPACPTPTRYVLGLRRWQPQWLARERAGRQNGGTGGNIGQWEGERRLWYRKR